MGTKRFILNTDRSSMGNPGRGGIGGVISNIEGEGLLGYISNLYATNSLKAKLTVLLQGIELALNNNLTPIEININCEDIFSLLENDHTQLTLIYCLIKGC